MANNESTNIAGNKAGEKLTQQKKEVSIVEDTDGTVRLCTAAVTTSTESGHNVKIEDAATTTKVNVGTDAGKNAMYVCSNSLATKDIQEQQQTTLSSIDSKIGTTTEVEKKSFCFQKVTGPYVFGNAPRYNLLMENPSPSDLVDGNDLIESNEFSNTNEAVVLSAIFCSTNKTNKSVTHLVRCVNSIGIKRNSATGTVYFSFARIYVGYIDSAGNFGFLYNMDAPYYASADSGTYIELCLQAFIGIENDISLTNRRLGIKVEVWGRVDLPTTVGQAKINCTRGSADSYTEIELKSE